MHKKQNSRVTGGKEESRKNSKEDGLEINSIKTKWKEKAARKIHQNFS